MNFVRFNESSSEKLTYVNIDLKNVESYEDVTSKLTSAVNEGKIALEGLSEEASLLMVTMDSGHQHMIICSKPLFEEHYAKAKKGLLLG